MAPAPSSRLTAPTRASNSSSRTNPAAKASAVRAALAQATGYVVLIQDADLEYSLDDYEKLLAPSPPANAPSSLVPATAPATASRCASSTTSRSMRFSSIPRTGPSPCSINGSLGIWLKDPFTMYKVFRRDALKGLTLKCNRFDFDWELLIKLIRAGHRPIESRSATPPALQRGKKVAMFATRSRGSSPGPKSRFGPL